MSHVGGARVSKRGTREVSLEARPQPALFRRRRRHPQRLARRGLWLLHPSQPHRAGGAGGGAHPLRGEERRGDRARAGSILRRVGAGVRLAAPPARSAHPRAGHRRALHPAHRHHPAALPDEHHLQPRLPAFLRLGRRHGRLLRRGGGRRGLVRLRGRGRGGQPAGGAGLGGAVRLRGAPRRLEGGDARLARHQPVLRAGGHGRLGGAVRPPRRLLPRAQAAARQRHRRSPAGGAALRQRSGRHPHHPHLHRRAGEHGGAGVDAGGQPRHSPQLRAHRAQRRGDRLALARRQLQRRGHPRGGRGRRASTPSSPSTPAPAR